MAWPSLPTKYSLFGSFPFHCFHFYWMFSSYKLRHLNLFESFCEPWLRWLSYSIEVVTSNSFFKRRSLFCFVRQQSSFKLIILSPLSSLSDFRFFFLIVTVFESNSSSCCFSLEILWPFWFSSLNVVWIFILLGYLYFLKVPDKGSLWFLSFQVVTYSSIALSKAASNRCY